MLNIFFNIQLEFGEDLNEAKNGYLPSFANFDFERIIKFRTAISMKVLVVY